MARFPFVLSRERLPGGRRPPVRALATGGYEAVDIPDPNDPYERARQRPATADDILRAEQNRRNELALPTGRGPGLFRFSRPVQYSTPVSDSPLGPDPNSSAALTAAGLAGARRRATPLSSAIAQAGDANFERPGTPGFLLSRPLQDPRWRGLFDALIAAGADELEGQVGAQGFRDPKPFRIETAEHRRKASPNMTIAERRRVAASPELNRLAWELGLSRDIANTAGRRGSASRRML